MVYLPGINKVTSKIRELANYPEYCYVLCYNKEMCCLQGAVIPNTPEAKNNFIGSIQGSNLGFISVLRGDKKITRAYISSLWEVFCDEQLRK